MIRVLEGGGHYMGMMTEFSDVGGVANRPGLSSVAIPAGDVIAHELGHNMSLQHAPCSTPDPDPRYPYPDGTIGAVGYDFAGEYDLVGGGGLVEAWRYDLMGYCGPPNWGQRLLLQQGLEPPSRQRRFFGCEAGRSCRSLTRSPGVGRTGQRRGPVSGSRLRR